MDLRQIRYFVALADELHFGRASRRLNISQPPLSRQIQNLEGELKVRLFERNRRRVQLTYAGQIFCDQARVVLSDVERAMVYARRAELGEIGHLEIGYSSAADLSIVPALVPVLRKQMPDVALTLQRISGPALPQALRDGRVRVAILRLPAQLEEFETMTLKRERLVAIMPEAHDLTRSPSISIRALAKEQIVLFPRRIATQYYDMIAEFCASRGGFILSVAQESETIGTTLGLVAAGVGVSLQPESVQNMTRVGVVCRTIRESTAFVLTGLAFRRNDRSQLLANFLNLARSIRF